MKYVLFLFAVLLQAATLPQLPQVYFTDTDYTAPVGKIITVHVGGDLQAALNAAVGGDEIVVDAGARFVGSNFTAPNHLGTGYVTVRTSVLLPEHVRASVTNPGAFAALSGNNGGVLMNIGSYWRFIGIEFTKEPGVINSSGAIVAIGTGTETQEFQLPHHVIIDRSWVHGLPQISIQRGVMVNGSYIAVMDSVINEIHTVGVDTQAIAGWNIKGPVKILNNDLEAAGENLMWGGSPPTVPSVPIPSDIEVRRNYLHKNPAWRGTGFAVKNLLELKNVQRLLVDSNILEYNWLANQTGVALVFQNADTIQARVQDVTLTNNIIRHSSNGLTLCSTEAVGGGCIAHPGQPEVMRILIQNTLFDDINGNTWGGGSGRGFAINNFATDITYNHNTILNYQGPGSAGNLMVLGGDPSTGIVFTNSIIGLGDYGIKGDGTNSGAPSISKFLPSSLITGNVLAGDEFGAMYPPGNLNPVNFQAVGFTNYNNGNGGDYSLLPTSPYKGTATDGKDPGVDWTVLMTAVKGVIDGSSTPTPIPPIPIPPSPSPVPNKPPTISILQPVNGAILKCGTILFTSKSSDPEEGDVSAKVIWSGAANSLGIATQVSFSCSGSGLGLKTVVATVVDSGGLSAVAKVQFTIVK